MRERISRIFVGLCLLPLSLLRSDSLVFADSGPEVNAADSKANKSKGSLKFEDFLAPARESKQSLRDQLDAVKVRIDEKVQRRNSFWGIRVTVLNETDRTIEINGEQVSLESVQQKRNCASMTEIESKINTADSPRYRLGKDLVATVAGAATVGAALAARDQLNEMGRIEGRFGFDEKRREELLTRFGKRVLCPNDTTSGVVYFEGKLAGDITLSIPVSDFCDGSEQAKIQVKCSLLK